MRSMEIVLNHAFHLRLWNSQPLFDDWTAFFDSPQHFIVEEKYWALEMV